MNYKTKIAFALAVFCLSIFCCGVAAAQGTNCPPEPAQNTPIYDGQVYIGSNCNLYSPGDVDSFVFNASSGQTYHLALGINGAAPVNICMALYDPNFKSVFSQCTNTDYGYGTYSVVDDQALTTSGTYTIVVTESSSGTISYALALERLYPFAPNAQQINLSTQIPSNVDPITDTNEFTFASATTGTEEVTVTLPSNATQNICLRVYNPDGSKVQQNDACTNIDYGYGTYIAQIDFTPAENGMSMAFVYVVGNDETATYTLEASCLLGMCGTTTIPDLAGYLLLGGTPLANQLVGIVSPSPGGDKTTTTDQNGYFQFVTVPNGTYTVYAPISGSAKDTSAESVHASPDR